jgi:hypothetical protein
MNRRRSRLPWVLILALVSGVGLFRWYGDFTHESARVPVGEDFGKAPDGFGPIPTATAPDDRSPPAVAPRQADAPSDALRNLAARMSRDTEGLQVVTHADGRRSVNLGGRFMHMSAAVTGVDGKTEVRCFSDYQEMAAAATVNPAPAVPQPTPHDR